MRSLSILLIIINRFFMHSNGVCPGQFYAKVVPTKKETLIATANNEAAIQGAEPNKIDALAKKTLEKFQLYFYQKWLQEKIV